jgi:sulfoacetaldehyde acetyltransferase
MTSDRGKDGFQETNQLPIFQPVTKFQVQVPRADRIAESFRTAFRVAMAEHGPVQVDVPRDFLYHEVDVDIPQDPSAYRVAARGAGDEASLDRAAEILAGAKNPVIVAGSGVTDCAGADEVRRVAQLLNAPVATTYMHTDAYPSSDQLAVGPLGYQGSKAAMRLIAEADVVFAVGTRLGGFGTLPQWGIDYWPKQAKIVQVDIDPFQVGRVRPLEVGIIGDAKAAAKAIADRLDAKLGGVKPDAARLEKIAAAKRAWADELDAMSSSDGTPISPRRALKELAAALPGDVILTSDIGNVCSTANAYVSFESPRSYLTALGFGN